MTANIIDTANLKKLPEKENDCCVSTDGRECCFLNDPRNCDVKLFARCVKEEIIYVKA